MNYSSQADLGQVSLQRLFMQTGKPIYNNVYPLADPEENRVFNYWWIAHLIDVRIDGFLRCRNPDYREGAAAVYGANRHRNHDTLVHEYYDDMLWNGLAALRLYTISGDRDALADAREVCDDVYQTAWNSAAGGGFAWKRTQIGYKNTPANAPWMILALRLYQIEQRPEYLARSLATLHWLHYTLVDPKREFVNDGINRLGDGEVDHWTFTYNQGVYIGALIEFYHVTHDQRYLQRALRCARTAIEVFSKHQILVDEGDGGDIGLFKGILYRYLALLYQETHEQFLREYIQVAVQHLV